MTSWILRTARPEDASALASLAEETFRDAFAADNRAEDMDAYCAGAFGTAIQAGELVDPAYRTVVAVADGAFVGYGQLRIGAPPEGVAPLPASEILRLYVRRDRHGSGVAAALMSQLLATARTEGSRTVWLGVWERNARAIRFYEKQGFRAVGHHLFVLGSDPQRDLVLCRDASDAATDARFLDLAVEAALATEREGNLPIGAVLVWHDTVVATGANRTMHPAAHPGRHAEIEALAALPPELLARLPELTCYTTLEPCVMCLGTLVQHRVGRVVYGALDPRGGGTRLLPHLPPDVAREAGTVWVGPAAPAICDPLYARAAAAYWREDSDSPRVATGEPAR